MQKDIKLLSGLKTYLIAALSAVTAVLAYLNGKESLSTALTSVPGALLYLGAGLAALRAAVAKLEVSAARIEAKFPAAITGTVDPVVSKAEKALNSKI